MTPPCEKHEFHQKNRCENIPIFRNRKELDERKKLKKNAPQDWWKKQPNSAKSPTAILFVPPTPHGKLAKALRQREAELNSNSKMSIRIIEKGGVKVKSLLTKADPFPNNEKCDVKFCPFCDPFPQLQVDPNQDCKSHNVGYSISCDSCDMKYEGETHRKIGVRGSEHVKDLKKKSEANPLYKHQTMHHPQGGCTFKLKVTGKFIDALSRQADEGVRIQKLADRCMNSKSEFHKPAIKRISIIPQIK